MQVRGTDFIAIGVTDMKKAQTFYRDTLGLTPLVESGGWSEYETGNMALALVDVNEDGGIVPTNGWKNSVVGLAVADVQATSAELQEKGVTILGNEEFNVCYMAMFEDPFGNRLFLHQRKDGSVG